MIFLRVLVKISPAQNKTFSREASVFHGQNFRNEIKKSIHYNFDGHKYKKPLQKKGAFKICIGFSRTLLRFAWAQFLEYFTCTHVNFMGRNVS